MSNHTGRKIEFRIRSYSLDAFKDIICNASSTSRQYLDSKPQLTYLDSYLRHPDIDAKSILVETPYIDRDYLADYGGYYVRCFASYHRWCSRLHFFATELDDVEFRKLLRGEESSHSSKQLKDTYRGFIVIKPLPETMFGRTCLKTYDMVDGRDFPNVRPYTVNLFGIKLEVNSLAFQEQDTVAAACASSALWTAFQGTGLLFQHNIPSPLAITRSAIERCPTPSRAFPASDGLSDIQMAEAVRSIGLDPLVLPIYDNWSLIAASYAYLRSGIPIVWLGGVTGLLPSKNMSLFEWLRSHDQPDFPAQDEVVDVLSLPNGEGLLGHAITLTGYRLNKSAVPKAHPQTKTILRACRVDKLYMHDDNIGPFARFECEPRKICIEQDGKLQGFCDWLSCKLPNDVLGHTYITERILIPLFTTIRIPFYSILSAVLWFDNTLEILRSNGKARFDKRFEWDVYLSTQNAYKTECFEQPGMDQQVKEEFLLTPLPRYIWLAVVYDGDKRMFDFIFDSTDIEQGLKLLRIVPYDTAAFEELLQASDTYSADLDYDQERLTPHGKIWEHLHELYLNRSSTVHE